MLSGCVVNKKPLPWPPVDETQEMPVYLYGPIYEVSSAPKTGKHFALLKKVILEIVEHPEKYLPQEYLERISGIGYEHYFDTLVQSDEWSTIKGMACQEFCRELQAPVEPCCAGDRTGGLYLPRLAPLCHKQSAPHRQRPFYHHGHLRAPNNFSFSALQCRYRRRTSKS